MADARFKFLRITLINGTPLMALALGHPALGLSPKGGGEGELCVQAKILINYENFYWVDRDE